MECNGCIYVIVDEDFCKIGVSSNPYERILALQTGNPRPLALYYSKPCSDVFACEKEIHSYLESFMDSKRCGEWFEISPQFAKSLVNEIIEKMETTK